MKKTLLIASVLLLQSWTVQATPRINIGGLNDYLEASKTTQVKRIYNSGTSTAFVKVSVWELVLDADGKYQEVSLDGQSSAERALVVSPARLIIPASGMQSVRLLHRGSRDHERYFRLRFNPVMPEAGDDFEVSAESAKDYQQSLSVGVQVMAGYGSILYVHPEQPKFDFQIDDSKNQLLVRNNGNTTVMLDRFRGCEQRGVNCESPVIHHLLPGAVRRFDKALKSNYSFDLIEGVESKSFEF